MIELKDGYKTFPDGKETLCALQNVNLRIAQGEFVAIMGHSGSGKSTLLHILGCMDTLTEGCYFFQGQPIDRMKERQLAQFRGSTFGFVFQSYYLIKEFTALQNVEAPMGYAGVPSRQRKARAYELLRLVGLEGRAGHYPDQLSGGQQQRVAIARALANQPQVLFADEPTGNLDRENRDLVLDLFDRLHQDGMTIILITHDERVGQRAQRQIHLEGGRIV